MNNNEHGFGGNPWLRWIRGPISIKTSPGINAEMQARGTPFTGGGGAGRSYEQWESLTICKTDGGYLLSQRTREGGRSAMRHEISDLIDLAREWLEQPPDEWLHGGMMIMNAGRAVPGDTSRQSMSTPRDSKENRR